MNVVGRRVLAIGQLFWQLITVSERIVKSLVLLRDSVNLNLKSYSQIYSFHIVSTLLLDARQSTLF